MASSSSTQKTDQQLVTERLKAKKIAAMVQTQNETTTIPPDKEQAFRTYLASFNVKDLDKPESHYDYRGAFLAGAKPDKSGHWPDTFKQHGHPTFSIESQYSKGPQDGGHWVGEGNQAVFVPPGQDSGPIPAKKKGALDAFGPAPINAKSTGALDGFATPIQVGPPRGTGALSAFSPEPITTRDPLTDTITQHPDFPVPLIHSAESGEFTQLVGNTVYGVAAMAREALLGAVNVLAGPPVPEGVQVAKFGFTTQDAIERQLGKPFTLTQEQMDQNRMAAAFVASSLAGGAAASTIFKGLSPFAKTFLSGTVQGPIFGALRPHGPDESVLGAMFTDLVAFGGLSLVGGLIGKYTRPLHVGIDELEAAGIKVHPEALKGREAGKALFEEIQHVADDMQSETFAEGVPRVEESALDPTNLPGLTRARTPDNIGILRRIFGSPSHWHETGGIVGEASERLVTNFRNRAALARRVYAEWDATLKEAEHVLFAGRFVLPAQRQFEKEEFGKLLDTIFSDKELPARTPPQYILAFKLLRDRLLADREFFRLQKGGSPDYGIDAYLPHVWVGDYSIVNAETNEILRPGVKWNELRQVGAQVIAENPNIKLRGIPREWILPTDVAQFGIAGDKIAPFIERGATALSLEPEEFAQLLAENRIVRIKTPGKRFFGHTEARSANLPGYVLDPFQALRLYASGAARNMAFYNARENMEAILSKLGEFRGVEPSIATLRSYGNAVLGISSQSEKLVREGVKQMARWATKRASPGVQEFAEDFGEGIKNTGRSLMGLVAKAEAVARLGYNPMSWLVQLSQTIVNTASEIGYGPTLRGLRLLYDKNQQAQVDALLRAADIRLIVPLADADRILARNIGVRSPFSPLYMFNKADTGNSAVAFLASYQDQILKGADVTTALKNAKIFRTRTNFDYSIADAPLILRGQVGSTLFQFKKFFIKEVEFVNRLSPAGKARFIVNVWALFGVTGLFSLPPLALANWATGAITGETVTERMQRLFPQGARGIPGFFGVDFGGAGSVGTPREISDLFGPGVLDFWTLAHDVAGPELLNLVRGKGGNLSPSDRARAFSELIPTIARRLADAYDIYSTGLVQVRGTHVPKLNPENPESEALLTAFGIKSLEASEEQRVWNTMYRQQGMYEADRQALLQRVVNAYFDGEEDHMQALIEWGVQQNPPLLVRGEEIRGAIAATALPRTLRGAVRGPKILRGERVEGLPSFLFPH